MGVGVFFIFYILQVGEIVRGEWGVGVLGA